MDWAKAMAEEGWVRRNWAEQEAHPARFHTAAEIINRHGRWSTKGDDSQLADLAGELGVGVRITGYLRCCIK